jgi:hypothetical protein
LEAAPSSAGLSATSADAFGAVAMSPPADAGALAVGLLHETQHSILNASRTLFDLVNPPANLGYSPWRDDPRPPFGIMHGAYAYLAVTRFWRNEASGAAEPGGRLAAFEFTRWRATVVAAADGLLSGDRLAPAGRRFAEELRDEAHRWRNDPVDTDVARLAGGANAEHRARWRLRNLVVAPETVDAMVTAWRQGSPPPETPAPTVRRDAPRILERSRRLDLVHHLLRDPPAATAHRESGPRGGVRAEGHLADRAGDAAYLAGDHGTAFEAYGRAVTRSQPDHRDLDLWAGLAVVSPYAVLRDRPELVRAVHRALSEDVDLHVLARWLGG